MVDDGGRRRVGRPARIDRAQIAAAASEIGLDDLTLRAVADRLGVSITGLYHHIEDKDDLMRLAAEHTANRVATPEDRGQHWAVWLDEWARASHAAFLAEPGLIAQYLEGAISAEVVADKFDAALGVLVAQGFTIRQAQSAFELVSSLVVGAALRTIQERRAIDAGRAVATEHRRVIAGQGGASLVNLRALLADLSPRVTFAEHLATVLVAIAVERGEDGDAVAAQLAARPQGRSRGRRRGSDPTGGAGGRRT